MSRGAEISAVALAWLAIALAAFPGPASARALTLAKGEQRVELTLQDLASMPQHVIRTRTDFTDRPVIYRGPLARDVLARAGLDTVRIVRFTALNDYFVDIPVSDFAQYDVILALEADGQPLSRRDKGPIWLMYPISDNPELDEPRYNARLIWQVVRAEAP